MADVLFDGEFEACSRCNGRGEIECSTCGGRGGRQARRFGPRDFSFRSFGSSFGWESCLSCDGRGRATCPVCLGESMPEPALEEPAASDEGRSRRTLLRMIEDLRGPGRFELPDASKAERWAARLELLAQNVLSREVIQDIRQEIERDLAAFGQAYPRDARIRLGNLNFDLAALEATDFG